MSIFPERIDDAATTIESLRFELAQCRLELDACRTSVADLQEINHTLVDNEQRLRLAIAADGTGLWVWNSTDLENAGDWSPRLKEIMGLPPDAEVTHDMFLACVHPQDRERINGSVMHALSGADGGRYVAEYRTISPADGSEHWVNARGQAFFDAKGKAIRFIGTVMDITEHKRLEAENDRLREDFRRRAEETLRETKAALAFTLESVQIGDWDWDVVTDTSRRSLRHDQCFGYDTPIPETEWGIDEFIQHVHAEDRERVEASLRQAIGALQDWAAEFRVVWPDGSVHWLATRGSIYRTSEGRAMRMLGIVMDVTERKRAEEALSASEQLARGQVEALKSTLDVLAREPAPERLVEHMLSTITNQWDAHSSSVWWRDAASGLIGLKFVFENDVVIPKTDAAFADMNLWLPMEEFWPWPEVFRTGKSHLIEDIRDVPPFDLRDRLISMGIITVLLVPMSIAGCLEGAIGLHFTRKRVFRAEETELAQALANQAMLAMQLMRLSAESSDAAVMAERNRMARDIHDTLAQGFTGIIVQLEAGADATSKDLPEEAARHMQRASELARESLREARRSVLALRPHALKDKDLCAALKGLIHKMTVGTSLQAQFVLRGEPRKLASEWEANLLRVGQEAVTNALRHAQARHLVVNLIFKKRSIHLGIRDDGVGFDLVGRSEGFGLLGMRERVKSMGGRISIDSTVGTGTAILIVLPYVAA